jgi:hypothetical protein
MRRRGGPDDDFECERLKEPTTQRRPRRRKRRSTRSVWIFLAAAGFVGVVGIVVIVLVLVPGGVGTRSTATTAPTLADELIDRLAGEWESPDYGGKAGMRLSKDHTVFQIAGKDAIRYTWELESASKDVLVLRTTSEQGRMESLRFTFLPTQQLRLESLKSNRSLLLTRKR